jgi:Domain of unknown function (DUF4203)
MKDVIVGLIAIAIGAMFCFRGYLAMRVIIPIWGAFAGFVFGAGLLDAITGDGFLGSVVGWLAGLATAVVFAALAYFYYEISVMIAMGAVGFVLGTSVMAALGVNWSWVVVLVGVAAGAVLAFLAITADLPMVLLTVLTAAAGASTVVAGLMLMFDTVSVDDFDSASTTDTLADDWWWYAIYGALVVAGIISQVRATRQFRTSLREAWEADGGRQLRSSS